jgi:hypothetical protein
LTYQWSGIKKISLISALTTFQCRKKVYLIHKDGTTTEVTSVDDIYKHFGDYGIEAQ